MITLTKLPLTIPQPKPLLEPTEESWQELREELRKAIASAKEKFQSEAYEEAQAKYQAIYNAAREIKNKELMAYALTMIGSTFRNQGQLSEAKGFYIQATEVNPKLFEAWECRAVVSFNLEDYSDAVLSCNKALALRPDEAELWLFKGYALAAQKQNLEALTAIARGLELKPDAANEWLIHASLLTEQSEWDKAIASFERAFALRKQVGFKEPLYYRYALALLARGIEVMQKGDLDRAQELMAQLRRLQIQGRIERRAKVVRQAIKDFKTSFPQHWESLSALLAMLKEPLVRWKAASYIIGEYWPKGLSVVEALRRARK